MSKLAQMVELIKGLKIGQEIKYRDLDAKISAFSDENVFLTVPQIAVPPEEFEGTVGEKRIRDKKVEDLTKEIYRLNEEIRRLLNDPRYYDHARYQENRRNEMRRDAYRGLDLAFDSDKFRNPRISPVARMDEIPVKEYWIDPLTFKTPTQKK